MAFGEVGLWGSPCMAFGGSSCMAFGGSQPLGSQSMRRSMHGLNLGLNMFSSCLEMQRVLVQLIIVLLLGVIVEQQLAPAMAMQVARPLCLHACT
jgi:hypothetical protein